MAYLPTAIMLYSYITAGTAASAAAAAAGGGGGGVSSGTPIVGRSEWGERSERVS